MVSPYPVICLEGVTTSRTEEILLLQYPRIPSFVRKAALPLEQRRVYCYGIPVHFFCLVRRYCLSKRGKQICCCDVVPVSPLLARKALLPLEKEESLLLLMYPFFLLEIRSASLEEESLLLRIGILSICQKGVTPYLNEKNLRYGIPVSPLIVRKGLLPLEKRKLYSCRFMENGSLFLLASSTQRPQEDIGATEGGGRGLFA